MRRRNPPPPAAGESPVALLIGPCVEVWSDDRPKPWSGEDWAARTAWANWSRARRAHAKTTGGPLTSMEHRAPYSVEFLISTGRAELATQHLADGGATVADLDQLRAWAGTTGRQDA